MCPSLLPSRACTRPTAAFRSTSPTCRPAMLFLAGSYPHDVRGTLFGVGGCMKGACPVLGGSPRVATGLEVGWWEGVL
eukprot:9422619-Alexandrium_andersonii.AAC.1